MKVSNWVHFTKIWVTIATKWRHAPFYIRPNNLLMDSMNLISRTIHFCVIFFIMNTTFWPFGASYSLISCGMWPGEAQFWSQSAKSLKVARSDFWVTLAFNFERLELHHYQSNRKSYLSAVLEKDESFKLGTFHQDLSYHSNEMTPCPILHKTE